MYISLCIIMYIYMPIFNRDRLYKFVLCAHIRSTHFARGSAFVCVDDSSNHDALCRRLSGLAYLLQTPSHVVRTKTKHYNARANNDTKKAHGCVSANGDSGCRKRMFNSFLDERNCSLEESTSPSFIIVFITSCFIYCTLHQLLVSSANVVAVSTGKRA